MGGHSGVLKTLKRALASLYWLGMKRQIQSYAADCSVSPQNKYSTLSPSELLKPLPIPQEVWEDLSLDFIEGLPKSEGWDTILVVVDHLSKYAHFIPLKHSFTAVTVTTFFVQVVVRLHGVPHSIVSYCDKLFLSHF